MFTSKTSFVVSIRLLLCNTCLRGHVAAHQDAMFPYGGCYAQDYKPLSVSQIFGEKWVRNLADSSALLNISVFKQFLLCRIDS